MVISNNIIFIICVEKNRELKVHFSISSITVLTAQIYYVCVCVFFNRLNNALMCQQKVTRVINRIWIIKKNLRNHNLNFYQKMFLSDMKNNMYIFTHIYKYTYFKDFVSYWDYFESPSYQHNLKVMLLKFLGRSSELMEMRYQNIKQCFY